MLRNDRKTFSLDFPILIWYGQFGLQARSRITFYQPATLLLIALRISKPWERPPRKTLTGILYYPYGPKNLRYHLALALPYLLGDHANVSGRDLASLGTRARLESPTAERTVGTYARALAHGPTMLNLATHFARSVTSSFGGTPNLVKLPQCH